MLSAVPLTTTVLVQAKAGETAQLTSWLTRHAPGATVQSTDVTGMVAVSVPSANLRPTIDSIRANPSVAFAQKQSTYQIAATPNDPSYLAGSLYGLNGSYGIKADKAWDTTTGSASVVVAVIDTGIDYTHVDLYKNIWINQGEIPASVASAIKATPGWDVNGNGRIDFWDLNDPKNQGAGKITDLDGDGRITGADILKPVAQGGWADGINNDNDAQGHVDDLIGWNYVANNNNPMDDNGHGTHVSGTIGATGNNSTGVVGVNWNVELMAMKFLDSSGSGYDSNSAAAIRQAADDGARVSNNSYGGPTASAAMSSAIDYAATKNELVVAAAGNSGTNNDVTPSYPAAYTQNNVIAVAATDSAGNRASFSNYGATSVDIGAPGVGIYSTLPGNSYGTYSGTSMASPHVAGAAALLAAQNPALGYASIKSLLLNNTTALNSLTGVTVSGGLLNIAKAVAANVNGPVAQVSDGGTSISDNSGVSDFGSAITGAPVSKTFTITNGGTQTLTLGTPTVPSGFTITQGFGSTTLAPGASTTLTVRLDATTAGNYSGQLSFATNDPVNNPFNFTVQGSVGTKSIMDNGDAGYSSTKGFVDYSGQGYSSDLQYAAAGSGSESATWTFTVAPGIYRVSTTWTANPNRATNAPYAVYDGGTQVATASVNQQVAPGDLTDAGTTWKDIGASITITGTTLTVKLTNLANQYVIADAIRIEKVGDIASGPVAAVSDGGTTLTSGSSTDDFGSTTPGAPVTKTFTVKNTGNQPLTLGTPTVPAGFTLTGNLGSTTLAAGATTTFTVRLDAAAAGSYSGTVSIATNDPARNPFTFTVKGAVAAKPVVQIIDDGDAGYSSTGGFINYSGQGYQGDVHYAAAGSGSESATWTFTVAPGVYRVSATWSANPNRATNAPFAVYDGGTQVASAAVNQQLTPGDLTDAGTGWKDIGTSITITGTTLTVKLTNLANQYVIADAIRIEKVG